MITHVCFISLTLARSLGKCLSTQPIGLLLKHLPQDPANVNALKNMCDSHNITLHDHINNPPDKSVCLKIILLFA